MPFFTYNMYYMQTVLVVKNLLTKAGDLRDGGSIPGSGRSSGEGHSNPLQYSCQEIPMDRGAWQGLSSIGLQRVRHDCSNLACTHRFSVQFSRSVVSDSMNRSMPSLPVHHHLPEFTQTHVLRVSDAIQPSHPLSSPSAPNPSQHQSLFQ